MPVAGKPLEIYIVAGLGLNSDLYAETFDSLEASVKYTIGKTAYYLGYYFQADGTGMAGMGIAREWLDMDVAGCEQGAR